MEKAKPEVKYLVRHRSQGFLVTRDVFSDQRSRALAFDEVLDAAFAIREVFGPEVDLTQIEFVPHVVR